MSNTVRVAFADFCQLPGEGAQTTTDIHYSATKNFHTACWRRKPTQRKTHGNEGEHLWQHCLCFLDQPRPKARHSLGSFHLLKTPWLACFAFWTREGTYTWWYTKGTAIRSVLLGYCRGHFLKHLKATIKPTVSWLFCVITIHLQLHILANYSSSQMF